MLGPFSLFMGCLRNLPTFHLLPMTPVYRLTRLLRAFTKLLILPLLYECGRGSLFRVARFKNCCNSYTLLEGAHAPGYRGVLKDPEAYRLCWYGLLLIPRKKPFYSTS